MSGRTPEDVLIDALDSWINPEEAARVALSAIAAAGYAVVPVEPTEAMLLEGNLAAVNSRQSGISGMSIDAQHRNIFHREIACYRAMLAAAGETKE
jgi:hypothetical protein